MQLPDVAEAKVSGPATRLVRPVHIIRHAQAGGRFGGGTCSGYLPLAGIAGRGRRCAAAEGRWMGGNS